MHDRCRPVLMFYCQHSLGIGHLTRSIALATALTQRFCVVLLNGGPLPTGIRMPEDVVRVDLPPLGMDDGHTVVSRDPTCDVATAWARRRRVIDAAVERFAPAVVLVELFPFGRKKFAGEILSLLRGARLASAGRVRIVCSVRDILVDARRDQQHHDDRARWLVDRYFDAVVVHSDPSLARLDESFRPSRAMRTPVYHTGYVVPDRDGAKSPQAIRRNHLLVSAGGGIVGGPLFECVLDAHARMGSRPLMRIVAGPFLPEAEWSNLATRVAGTTNVELVRQVPDLVAEMRVARASISQCGYNTALDIAVSGVPALVVPYEVKGETEQRARAQRLAGLGAVQMLAASEMRPDALASAIGSLLHFEQRALGIDLDGAKRTAAVIERLCAPAVALEAS